MTRTRQGTIYALIDPRDGKIRYIGKTVQPILTRLAGHLANPTNPAMRVWITGLTAAGLAPRIEAVATAAEERLDAEEQRQIAHHLKRGHRLLNSPYYQQHVADLSSLPTSTQALRTVEPGDWPPAMGLARPVFGRLARARAAGSVPAWGAGLIVVVTAPLYLALLILRALLNNRAGIRLTLAAAFGACLWDAGFDKAVRDLLLSRLPMEEWSTLWDIYVAPPLAEMAPSAVFTALFIAVLLAGGSYAEVLRSTPPPAHARTADAVSAAAAALARAVPSAVEGLTEGPKT
jgi:hypothetical protein